MGVGDWFPPLGTVAFAFTSSSESRRTSRATWSWRYWICAVLLGGSGPGGLPRMREASVARTRDTTVSLCKLRSSQFPGECR